MWHDIPCALNTFNQFICMKPVELRKNNVSSHDSEILSLQSDLSNMTCPKSFSPVKVGNAFIRSMYAMKTRIVSMEVMKSVKMRQILKVLCLHARLENGYAT
ncbi:uncharacterized protein [Amphiura filiformis]|uniref:uncharacterized protein n=1 Tax=Amphiura filiformis TaxID=82378 RepID=UPI003B20E9F1